MNELQTISLYAEGISMKTLVAVFSVFLFSSVSFGDPTNEKCRFVEHSSNGYWIMAKCPSGYWHRPGLIDDGLGWTFVHGSSEDYRSSRRRNSEQQAEQHQQNERTNSDRRARIAKCKGILRADICERYN
jgi:hypothetical protein